MKFKKVLFSILTLLLITSYTHAVQGTLSGKKGWVKGAGSQIHRVNCNPGERFTVTVSSDKKTNISIIYRTLSHGRRAGSMKASSHDKNRHTLSFTAPKSKPSNNMKYWNYEVKVMTGKGTTQTSYTISIR